MKTVYFVERKLNNARINHLKNLATQSKLFIVSSKVEDASLLLVTNSNKDETIEFLIKNKKLSCETLPDSIPDIVDIAWFFLCIKEKKLCCTEQFKLISNAKIENPNRVAKRSCIVDLDTMDASKKLCLLPGVTSTTTKYACQFSATLHHHNKKFCDALEILELHALYRGDKNSESRALAFRRGSASLKAYHKEITCENDLVNLPYVGQTNASKAGHCRKVILEILSEGFCDEVESVINSDFFRTMKIFCGIFGVGPATARKWYYDLHLHTLDDIRSSKVALTKDQVYGLEHYKDLNDPVTLEEAHCLLELIKKTCSVIDKTLTVTLAGGFRRGKQLGHDIDLLISQSEFEKTDILSKIIENLQDHFIYTDKKTYAVGQKPELESATMDHFDKCFSIIRFDKNWIHTGITKNNKVKNWKAIRLDLIMVPYNQFSFALLGWTGTKHFEREIRRYARAEKQIILTSHGMYSMSTKESFDANSEEEIFGKLGLEYRHPHERCF